MKRRHFPWLVSGSAAVPLAAMLGLAVVAAVPAARAGDYGTVGADARLRYETADMDGLRDGRNLSARLRLGYTTPTWEGLQALVEGEFTGVTDEDWYNAAGVHGDPARAVIADPKNAQLDQALVSYTYGDGNVKVGRQVIALDNHRFIGDSAWRQNRQTYDAVAARCGAVENLQLFYAYVDNVVRVYGSDAPASGANAEEADSSSHLINAAYKVSDQLSVTAYSYLLDLKDIPPTSSADSYGAIVQGTVPVRDVATLACRAEAARQTDAGNNPLDYTADYYHLSVDADVKVVTVGAGYEVLGAEDTGVRDEKGAPVFASFQTPLATLHKFNGFADRFLVTPPKGLEDRYVSLGGKVPMPLELGPLSAAVIYHDFASAEGSDDLGTEWDGVLTKPLKFKSIPGEFKVIGKVAFYQKNDTGADTDRASLELNYGTTF